MVKSGKKLVISVVVLVLAIALATTATFAWFSMNQSVSVGIDTNVTSKSDGLYVSFDGTTFNTEISGADIQTGAITWNDYLSTYDTNKKVELRDLTGTRTTTGENAEAVTTFALKDQNGVVATAGSYLDIPVFFQGTSAFKVDLSEITVTAANQYIKYSGTAVPTDFTTDYGAKAPVPAKGSDIKALYTDVPAEVAALDNDTWYLTANAANAVRVLVKDQSATVYNGKIYNPNKAEGFSGGTRNMAQDYLAEYLNQTPPAVATVVAPDDMGTTAETLVDAFKGVVTLAVEDAARRIYQGNVTLRVYLEGTDSDCFDAILSGKIKLNFSFKIDEASIPTT